MSGWTADDGGAGGDWGAGTFNNHDYTCVVMSPRRVETALSRSS